MYQITKNSNTVINNELALIRETNKAQALSIRKVYDNLQCRDFDSIPTTGADLVEAYSGTIIGFKLVIACNTIIEFITFEEVEEVTVPDIDVPNLDEDRFAFIETTMYEDMSAHQLSMCLFRDLGTEIEMSTTSMTSGLKLKLDLLDELKSELVTLYPSVRLDALTAKLANALAVTKLEKGSSLALDEGNLAVYRMMTTTKTIDSKNFEFLAQIGGDKTKSLDILILQSALRTYKEEVAKGELPATPLALTSAIMKMSSGIVKTTPKSLEGLQNLF